MPMHPGATGSRSGTRTHVTFLTSNGWMCPCPAAAAVRGTCLQVRVQGTRCKVQGVRTGGGAGLGWCFLDRRSQGMYHLRGLLRHLYVLKLRACGPTSVDGWTWWADVCVPVSDVVDVVMVEETWVQGGTGVLALAVVKSGYRASKHPLSTPCSSPPRVQQTTSSQAAPSPPSPQCSSQCKLYQSSSLCTHMGQCTITMRTSMGKIFPLTLPTFTSVTRSCSVATGAVILGMTILEIGITQTKEGLTMAWVTSGAVGGRGTV